MKLLSLALFFSTSFVFAEQSAVEELQALLADLDQYSARFEQTVTEEDGYLLDEQQGVMSFERPAKIYWQVDEPFPSTLISDGSQVYLFDPDLNQVTVRSWSADPSENPVAVFVGEEAIQDYYQVSKDADEFLLEPLRENSGYLEIRIGFKKDEPESMRILDSLGQVTQIGFSKARRGSIPKQPYEFQIPIDAEIIHE